MPKDAANAVQAHHSDMVQHAQHSYGMRPIIAGEQQMCKGIGCSFAQRADHHVFDW
jgi:hypothetical protein